METGTEYEKIFNFFTEKYKGTDFGKEIHLDSYTTETADKFFATEIIDKYYSSNKGKGKFSSDLKTKMGPFNFIEILPRMRNAAERNDIKQATLSESLLNVKVASPLNMKAAAVKNVAIKQHEKAAKTITAVHEKVSETFANVKESINATVAVTKETAKGVAGKFTKLSTEFKGKIEGNISGSAGNKNDNTLAESIEKARNSAQRIGTLQFAAIDHTSRISVVINGLRSRKDDLLTRLSKRTGKSIGGQYTNSYGKGREDNIRTLDD